MYPHLLTDEQNVTRTNDQAIAKKVSKEKPKAIWKVCYFVTGEENAKRTLSTKKVLYAIFA